MIDREETDEDKASNGRVEERNNPDRKRKRQSSADPYSRMAVSASATTKSGRGSEAGWTHCPLCGRHSKKLFAMGRGIASHLHAVHTPWKPGKIERQKRRRLAERRAREGKQKSEHEQADSGNKEAAIFSENQSWDPTPNEVEEWNKKVLQIIKELEEKQAAGIVSSDNETPNCSSQQHTRRGVDRSGKAAASYRSSLPLFLQAAADGDLQALKDIMTSKKGNKKEMWKELSRTDRHNSTAEHWAAGGGHLECLRYLVELHRELTEDNFFELPENKTDKIRRRDGKTPLHYAARNGHVHCIHYLVKEEGHNVDETSGDGSTPFHLACFGGHLAAVEALIHAYGCNPCISNEWDCNAAHWVGMTKCESTETVRKICCLLQKYGISFVRQQKQGHTALHKAAQRKNRHVIEWLAQEKEVGGAGLSDMDKKLAGAKDENGHKPSEIFRSFGGDDEFASWMKNQMGW